MRISDWSSDVCSSDLLMLACGGTGMDRNMDFLRHGMARIHYIVRTPPGTELTQSAAQIEQSLLAATQSWRDQLRDAYTSKHRGDTVLAARFFDAFPRSYQELSSADERSEEHTSELKSLMR